MTDWLGALTTLPDQAARAWEAAGALPPVPAGQSVTPQAIVFTGGGAAALAAVCAQALLTSHSPIPILVSEGYAVPACAGPQTLTVALSDSGTTEETVYAISDAADRGARVLAVTGGGHLRDIAQAQGFPCLLLPAEAAPLPPPLTLAPLFFALWGGLAHFRLLPPALAAASDVTDTLSLLRRQRAAFLLETQPERNPARQLADALRGTLPLVGGVAGSMAAAARVWAAAFSRVGGQYAFSHAFPAAEHDEATLWADASASPNLPLALLTLRSRDDPLVTARLDTLRRRVAEARPDLPWHEILADGDTPLARLWTTINLGLWTAAYLGR